MGFHTWGQKDSFPRLAIDRIFGVGVAMAHASWLIDKCFGPPQRLEGVPMHGTVMSTENCQRTGIPICKGYKMS